MISTSLPLQHRAQAVRTCPGSCRYNNNAKPVNHRPYTRKTSLLPTKLSVRYRYRLSRIPSFRPVPPGHRSRTSLPPSPTTVGLAAAQALTAANFQWNSILFAEAQQTPSRHGSRTANINRVSILAPQRDVDDEIEDDSNKESMAASSTPKASPITATIASFAA